MYEPETVQSDHEVSAASSPETSPESSPESSRESSPESSGTPPTQEQVLEALRNVYDPELGINIVDLGLVYEVRIDPSGDIDIEYSLTTMGCPIGPMIEDQMRGFLATVPGVGEVRPEMVIRPPWSPEMMSDEAKAALGIF
jgi:metal-sulfur cluster biosynthetic enzyme